MCLYYNTKPCRLDVMCKLGSALSGIREEKCGVSGHPDARARVKLFETDIITFEDHTTSHRI